MKRNIVTVALLIVGLPWGQCLRAAEPKITYASTVAKIMFDKCVSCHRPGQSGPFSLLTYEDVLQHSATIVSVIDSGYMPPWKAEHAGLEFTADRRLSDQQKQQLRDWVATDCPPGNLKETPAAPQFSSDWALGKPDLVIKMDEPFKVPASGRDIYRSFVFPVNLPDDKWIKAIELKPTARGAVHHALFFVVDAGSSTSRSRERDGQPGFRGMGFVGSNLTDSLEQAPDRMAGGLGGYVPGATPNKLPGDLARHLPAHSNIIMQTHFHPTGKQEVEQGELALYFTDIEPEHRLQSVQLPAVFGAGAGINVPAGEKNYRVVDKYTLPIDVLAHEVGGHAHYICREMEMSAKLPDGKQLTLLRIKDWDLDWQDQYTFAKPVTLPRGTELTTTIVYDNSADNPENPNSPPQAIAWGRESNDEMGAVTLAVTAVDEEQLPKLKTEMRQRAREAIRLRVRTQSNLLSSINGLGRFAGIGKGDGGLLFRLLDRNKDNVLQEEELPERNRERMLEFIDRNQDGEIDKTELEEGIKTLRKISDSQ